VASAEFIDNTGSIRATMFGSEVNEYLHLLTPGKVSGFRFFFRFVSLRFHLFISLSLTLEVYYLSKAKVKTNTGKFATSHNQFGITFSKTTTVVECPASEAGDVPMESYHCAKISQAQNLNDKDLVGLVVVVVVSLSSCLVLSH
jgi:hypothetical protein